MTTNAPTAALTAPVLCLAAAFVAVTDVAPAIAQAPAGDGRAFISVNGGLQAMTRNFSENIAFPESGGVYREVLSGAAAHEQARFESAYRFKTAMLFDVSGGVRVARHFGLGVGVSRFGIEDTARVSAQVPHPLFFDRDRSISGASPPLTRSERAIHLQALAIVPAGRSVTVTVFGGPTVFNVTQHLVTDVRFTHEYPYDTAAFSSTDTRREFGTTLGFHLGADVAYYFSAIAGIGGLIRYSRATAELPSAGDGALDIEVGGLHTVGGLRLRF